MTDKKISQLTEINSIDNTLLIPGVLEGNTVSVSLQTILASLGANGSLVFGGLTSETVIDDYISPATFLSKISGECDLDPAAHGTVKFVIATAVETALYINDDMPTRTISLDTNEIALLIFMFDQWYILATNGVVTSEGPPGPPPGPAN